MNKRLELNDGKHLKQFIELYKHCKNASRLSKVNNEEQRIFSLKETGLPIRFGCTEKLLDYIPEREGLYNSFHSDIAISLLPVIDNLEKAVSVQTEDNNYKVGVELVLKQFKEVLKSNGINEIEAVGKTFDPELHEAVSSVEDPALGVQEIKEEYRKGYIIGNKVIRHSLVVVAKTTISLSNKYLIITLATPV